MLSFITTPFFSWILYKWLSKKVILYLLIFTILFLIPIIAGYTYVIDNVDEAIIFIASLCCYSFIVDRVRKILISVVIPSIILFGTIGFSVFITAIAGSVTVERTWEIKHYKIKYLKDQGFSGGPLMTYQLYEYGFLPVIMKHVDSKVDNDTTNNCIVKFDYKNVRINKCNR